MRQKILRIYIYRKGVEYPASFVGTSYIGLMRNLKISEEDAQKLFIAKVLELIDATEDNKKKAKLLRIIRIRCLKISLHRNKTFWLGKNDEFEERLEFSKFSGIC
jgi:hypothetical protein